MLSRLLKNTGSNILLFVVRLSITLIMTPVFLNSLGDYDYGIWEIIVSVIGYMGLLDLGLRPTMVRYSSRYFTLNDNEQLQKLYATCTCFMIIIGSLCAAGISLWGFYFPETLTPEGSTTEKYTFLMFIIAFRLATYFPGQVAESFLEGKQAYQLKNNLTIISSIIGSTICYYYLTRGSGILLLAIVTTAGLTIKFLVYFYMLSFKKYGGLTLNFGKASLTTLKEIIQFGLKSLVQGISSRIENGSDRIIISSILGPAAIPSYAIATSLMMHIGNVRLVLTQAFLPLFSQIDAEGDHEKMKAIYLRSSRYLNLIMLLLITGTGLLGKEFISLWVGEKYVTDSAPIIYILGAFHLIVGITAFSSRFLTAIGKHGILAKLSPISAFISITTSIFLVHKLGIIGCAYGALLSVLLIQPFVLIFVCKELKIHLYQFFSFTLLPVVIPAITTFFSIYLLKQIIPVHSFFHLMFMAILTGLCYLSISIPISILKQDRALIFQWASKKIQPFNKTPG